jgi:hypothetical protein
MVEPEANWKGRFNDAPVFVVGASRSGTALIRSALNRHPSVHIAGETHYFDDLRVRLRESLGGPLSDSERREAEDYFLALSHRPYGHKGDPESSRIPRARLREAAASLGGDSDAVFEGYCKCLAEAEGPQKTIWGEKTPRHVFRIDDMLARFPRARVICMVRDARAVVASYRDWRNQGGFDFAKDPGHRQALEEEHLRTRQSYDPLIMSMIWKGTGNAAARAHVAHPERVYVQKYEDLVAAPERSLRTVAEWLGIEFHAAMLDVPMHNSTFSSYSEHHGISREAAQRWREKLSATEIGLIQFVCRAPMLGLGYGLDPVATPWPELARRTALLPLSVLRAARANRGRIANLPAYAWRRFRFASGNK